ncbi:hypothetical protein PUN28_015110 [Cardiocondyla obscurior]|uniref:Uncharacterized protein n=1 Tax=Cardiocondyla obscurior TaxID=286306 RepID=A0AAW2EYW8_9HYME
MAHVKTNSSFMRRTSSQEECGNLRCTRFIRDCVTVRLVPAKTPYFTGSVPVERVAHLRKYVRKHARLSSVAFAALGARFFAQLRRPLIADDARRRARHEDVERGGDVAFLVIDPRDRARARGSRYSIDAPRLLREQPSSPLPPTGQKDADNGRIFIFLDPPRVSTAVSQTALLKHNFVPGHIFFFYVASVAVKKQIRFLLFAFVYVGP